jgi:hypothetical protein
VDILKNKLQYYSNSTITMIYTTIGNNPKTVYNQPLNKDLRERNINPQSCNASGNDDFVRPGNGACDFGGGDLRRRSREGEKGGVFVGRKRKLIITKDKMNSLKKL